MLLTAVPTAVRRLAPVDPVPLGAQSRHGLIQAGLVGLKLNQQGVAGGGRAGERFLAVQRVGGEQDAPQAQLLDQRLGRRDLVAFGDLLMGRMSAASLAKALSSAAAWS